MKKVLCIVFVLAMLASCLSGCVLPEQGQTNPTNKIEDIPTPSGGNDETDNNNGNNTNDQNVGHVGQAVTGKKFKLSLLSAKTYESIKSGYFESKPEEGKVFVAMFFEVENISTEDEYCNYFYWQSYEDGYATDIKIILGQVEGQDVLTGDVAAGKKMKGYLLWEVSPQWQELEVTYMEDLFSDDKGLTFLVKPGDLT